MLRTASSLPHTGLLTLGSDPATFPGEAASLLPGLLAATRTGLPPAGDDELTNAKKHHGTTSRCHLLFCWAHRINSMKAKTTIVIFVAVLLLAASGWYAYAITYPAQTLANQGRCEESIGIKLINTTRRLFWRQDEQSNQR